MPSPGCTVQQKCSLKKGRLRTGSYYDSKPFQKRVLPITSGRACESLFRLIYSPSMKRVKETTSMVVPRDLATSAV